MHRARYITRIPCLSPGIVAGILVLSFDLAEAGPYQADSNGEVVMDESFTLTNIPGELAGGIWVMRANANNSNADSSYLNFDAGENPVTVYIAFDPAGNPPGSSTHAFSPVSAGGNKSGGSPAAQQAYLLVVVP